MDRPEVPGLARDDEPGGSRRHQASRHRVRSVVARGDGHGPSHPRVGVVAARGQRPRLGRARGLECLLRLDLLARTVPEGLDADDLVPVADYLEADPGTVERLIPFVWGIGEDGKLARLVVSRALVLACRDRLNYWRTLQELAGVHNFYVETAVERVLEDARAAAEAEREELLKAHEEELDSARSEAAGEAMGQLVDVLMGADLSSMVDVGGASAPTPVMPEGSSAEEAAPADVATEVAPTTEEPEEEEEELSFDEPWLDTASCTTCDDCMSINKQMFVYNADKQAILKDPKAGPYADLVKAAEICPAQCIHPGKPLDPNEPGLEELIARAAPFN